MAYVFRIHNSNDPHHAPVAEANVHDWTQTGKIEGGFIDNIIENNVNNPSKIGTSIPSPFARMYLFNTAFKIVNARGHDGGGDAYYQIVSECLDFLELLFAQSGNLTIKLWDKQQQLNALANSPRDEHKNLAAALRDTMTPIASPALGNFNKIYLFYYNGCLIGGTSPFTLVFTAPNWKDVANQFHLAGLHGPLFNGGSTALHLRDPEFVVFLQKFRLAYSLAAPAYMEQFFRYLSDEMGYLDAATMNNIHVWDAAHAMNALHTFCNEYDFINDGQLGQIMSGQYPLMKKRVNLETFVSDYIIRPSVEYYAQHRVAGGAIIPMSPPMALNRVGIATARYVGRTLWEQDLHQLNDAYIRTTDISQRELPGNMGIQYPFLAEQDLFEDKLIVVDYNINRERFVTCVPNNGNSKALLPIKKEYFDYFTIEDLERNFRLEKNNDGTYLATLRIPILCETPNYIEFSKIYSGEDIVDCSSTNKNFDLAIFPFYQVTDQVNLNQYKVMLGYVGMQDIHCQFYRTGNLATSLHADSCVRSHSVGVNPTTRHFTLANPGNNAFDFIELETSNCKGLIIPKMKKVSMVNHNKIFVFCVDFGTSNTHIAYSVDAGLGLNPHSFDIDSNDMQSVLFNASDANLPTLTERYEAMNLMGSSAPFNIFYRREFFPSIIKNGERVSYPTKTVSVENNDFSNHQGSLFGNISHGYNMMFERGLDGQNMPIYHSDLKWAYEKTGAPKALERVELYCLQLLWMIKNKVLMNDGNLPFKLVLTFPGRMTIPVKNAFKNAWTKAVQTCGMNIGDVDVIVENEAIAPYYSFCGEIFAGTDLLNVDIGGGTTDLLWVGSGTLPNYCLSAMFAANDLWGDGINADAPKDNGFMQYISTRIAGDNALTQSLGDLYYNFQALQSNAQTSADIMGFLFKNDDRFSTSNLIRNNTGLYSLVFVHYMALMYYVGHMIKTLQRENPQFGIPQNLTFTGMGSKYIKLISADSKDIAAFSKLLLSKFVGLDIPNLFNVRFAESPKEVTAEGGVKAQSHVPINVTERKDIYGITDAKSCYQYREVGDIATLIEREFNQFVSYLDDREIVQYLFENYELSISDNFKEDLKNFASVSLQSMINTIPDNMMGINVTEPLFFWPLKDAIYQMSKIYR